MNLCKHIIASILFSTVIYFACPAQDEPVAFDHYNSKNGLSNNEVNDVIQDDDGFIWIATRAGLNRFDGKDFTKYYADGSPEQLPSNDIYRLARFSGNRILVGTLKGMASFNTRTGKISQHIIPGDPVLNKYRNRILDIIVDSSHNVIVCTLTGIFVFDSAFKLIFRYEPFTGSDLGKKRIEFCYSLQLLKNGNIFIPATNDVFLLDMKRKTMKSVSALPASDWKLFSPWRTTGHVLFNWKDDNHCFVFNYITRPDSLNLYELNFTHQRVYSLNIPIAQKNEIHWKSSITFLTDSTIAVNSSFQNGIYLFHFDSLANSLVYTGKFLTGVQCNRIFRDKEKRLWISSDDGIFKQSFQKSLFHNTYIRDIGREHNIDNFVNGFAAIGDNLFVSIYATGVLRYGLQDKLPVAGSGKMITGIKLPWNIIRTSKDSLLIPTQEGAFILNADKENKSRFWKPGLPPSLDKVAITSILLDSRNRLWMGMGKGFGVFMINLNNHLSKIFEPGLGPYPFPIRYPLAMTEDQKGNIWMSGIEGITRWNQAKQQFDTLIKHIPGLSEDISGQWISVQADKSGNLWICPEEFVLIKWNLANGLFKIFRMPVTTGALRAHQIEGPWNGILWIPTNAGLLSFDVNTEKFKLIREEDGLPGDNAIDGRMYFDSTEGKIYAGFDKSFTWFEPKKLLRTERIPLTYITDIRAIGDSFSKAGYDQARFTHDHNSISISFAGINFDNGQSNQYAYRIFENQPAGWISIGSQKTLNFANLKPGKYTFQVKTAGTDDINNNGAASLMLIISPAFYQTYWFFTICLLIIALTLYALYRYRIQQLLRVQKVRINISSDLHDDIGARLTNMNILTMLSEQNLGNPEISGTYLSRISGEIQSSGEALDDIVWSINSNYDSLAETIARMRRYAAEQFEPTNIAFEFKTDVFRIHHKLMMDQRRDLFLVYKESITNILRHSGASKVSINIMNIKKQLHVSITDNGKGFDLSKPTHRHGILNMHTRIKKWQGKLTIESSPVSGTTIIICLP